MLNLNEVMKEYLDLLKKGRIIITNYKLNTYLNQFFEIKILTIKSKMY